MKLTKQLKAKRLPKVLRKLVKLKSRQSKLAANGEADVEASVGQVHRVYFW